MADNVLIPGTGSATAASDEVTYSGDTAQVQLTRIVQVTGAEGAKTVVDLPGDATAGLTVNLGANNDVTVTSGSIDVTDDATRDLGKVDVASLDQYTPVSGRLPVDGSGVTQPVSGTITANPASDVTASGTIDADGERVSLALEGRSGASAKITGTWSANVLPEVSYDGGTTWRSGFVWAPNSYEVFDQIQGNQDHVFVGISGATHVSITAPTVSSGAVVVALRATATESSTPPLWVSNAATPPSSSFALITMERTRGQATMAEAIPVTVASNQSAVPVSGTTFDGILRDGTGDTTQANVSSGRLHVDPSGVTSPVSLATLPPLVAGTANIGDVDVLTLPALVAGSANIGDVDVLTVPADPFGVNADAASATGSISAKLRFIAATGIPVTSLPALAAGTANIGDVDVLTLPAIPAGNNNIGDVDVASIAAGTNYVGKVRLTDGTLDSSLVDETGASAVDALAVGGGTPHGSADSGNPIKIGAKAVNAFPTAEANADRVNAISDLFGRLLTSHIDPAQQVWKSYNDTASRSAGSAQVVWDPTSGKKIAITHYTIAAYGTTAGRIFLFFADDADLTYTAGTDQPLFVGSYAPSSSSKPGTVLATGNTPIFCTTADRRLHYQNDAAISVDIVIYGYEW